MADFLGYLGIILFLAVAVWQLSIRIRVVKILIKLLAQPYKRRKD
jgi:hypothetical protein